MDEEGIKVEAIEAACRNGVRVFCCVPTLSNPTCAVMSVERRQAVADILKAHGAFLVEDDIYGLLSQKPLPPIASFAPENTLYVTSLSKSVSPGLRIGYLVVPSSLHDKACTAVRASCWMAAPLMAEIATRWIRDGGAAQILEAQRREKLNGARSQSACNWLRRFSDPGAHPVRKAPSISGSNCPRRGRRQRSSKPRVART
jgi:DNA-binding transcriptional MocR family regulator